MTDQLIALIIAVLGTPTATAVGVFIKRAVNSYIKRIVGLEENLKTQTARADAAEKRLKEQGQAINEQGRTIANLNKSLSALEDEVSGLESKLQTEQTARESAENRVLELKGRVLRQDKVIEALTTSSGEKDVQMESMKQRIDELVERVNVLTVAKERADERAVAAEAQVSVLMELQKASVAESRESAPEPSGESPEPETKEAASE